MNLVYVSCLYLLTSTNVGIATTVQNGKHIPYVTTASVACVMTA